MKYSTGVYQIILFGEYGEKVGTKKATSYMHARTKADKYLTKNASNSIVISYIVYNSKDKNNKWDYINRDASTTPKTIRFN